MLPEWISMFVRSCHCLQCRAGFTLESVVGVGVGAPGITGSNQPVATLTLLCAACGAQTHVGGDQPIHAVLKAVSNFFFDHGGAAAEATGVINGWTLDDFVPDSLLKADDPKPTPKVKPSIRPGMPQAPPTAAEVAAFLKSLRRASFRRGTPEHRTWSRKMRIDFAPRSPEPPPPPF